MSDHMRHLLEQINALEGVMQAELSRKQVKLAYQIKGTKIVFERAVRERHQQLKVGLLRWMLMVSPLNLLTAPIIYGMVVPLLVFDFLIMLYQISCFPIYRIPLVRRAEYFSYDHRHLAYLNIIEKFNCLYCSYANGLMAYSSEVVVRTEQYFCPIKHAQKLKGRHPRSLTFQEYGDATDIHERLENLRVALQRDGEVKTVTKE